MNIPAKKLGYIDISNVNKQLNITKLQVEYGKYIDNVFNGIRYYGIDDESTAYLLKKFLPLSLQSHFNVLLMIINYDNILPHTDSDISTVINYYIKGSDAITHFWKLKPNMQNKALKLENQTDGSIYNVDDLEHNYSFKAKDNEFWILNVKEIHSVLGAKNTRMAFCFQSQLSYNEVLNKFN